TSTSVIPAPGDSPAYPLGTVATAWEFVEREMSTSCSSARSCPFAATNKSEYNWTLLAAIVLSCYGLLAIFVLSLGTMWIATYLAASRYPARWRWARWRIVVCDTCRYVFAVPFGNKAEYCTKKCMRADSELTARRVAAATVGSRSDECRRKKSEKCALAWLDPEVRRKRLKNIDTKRLPEHR